MAAKADPTLSKYGVIVIDEVHQRTVATDLLLGILKKLTKTRKECLKIVVISATMDTEKLVDFFPGSKLEVISDKEYRVRISYLPQSPKNAEDTIVETILRVHLMEAPGNILVFASGESEMYKIISSVQAALSGPKARFSANVMGPLECWPLSTQLSPEAQENAIESVAPAGSRYGKLGRKLVVATNIAETSISLIGVTHVIDSCRVKVKAWNCRDESWVVREMGVSKASARQRAGVVGRTREGYVWRICTQATFQEHMPEQSVPAILKCDMLGEVLHILKMKLNPRDFPYITAPATETVIKAVGLLQELGALNRRGQISARGDAITSLPVDPYSAVVLLESPKFGCSDEIISIIAMVQASEGGSRLFINTFDDKEQAQIRKIRSKFRHPAGDHLTLFNIYMSWRAAGLSGTSDAFISENMIQSSVLREADCVRMQLLTILQKLEGWVLESKNPREGGYYISMLRALAAGNYLRVAKRPSRSQPKVYHTVRHGVEVRLSPETDLGPASDGNEWVFYNELRNNGPTKKTLQLVSAIRPELLVSTAPSYWNDVDLMPEGHIKDGMVNVFVRMTGLSEDYIRGGMPQPSHD